MKQICIFLALLGGLIHCQSFAQDTASAKQERFSVGGVLHLPGTNLEGYGVGYGGEATGYFSLSKEVCIASSLGFSRFGENSRIFGVDIEGERKRSMLQLGAGIIFQYKQFFFAPMGLYVFSFETVEFNQIRESKTQEMFGLRFEGGLIIQNIRISVDYSAVARPSGSFGSRIEGWYGVRAGYIF